MDIELKAAEVQRLANDRFDAETKGVSRLQWKAIADRIAEEVFGDDWEWMTAEEVGGRIHFAVTAYRHAPVDAIYGVVTKPGERIWIMR